MSVALLPIRAAMWLDYVVIMPVAAACSWRLALWWGRRRGDLMFWWRAVGRRAAIDNVRRAFGGAITYADAHQVVRASFRTQTCEEVETFFFRALTRVDYERYVRIEGRQHLEAAVAQGRGAIVFSYHYGSMCLAMIALAHLGFQVNVLARSIAGSENPLAPAVRYYARRKVAQLERIMGRPFIVAGEQGAMLKIRRALRDGEIVYVLLSVPPELARRRAHVRFLGQPAQVPAGTELIATLTGAPLVPFVVRPSPRGIGHVLEIRPEVPGPAAGAGTTQRCLDVIERWVWEQPGPLFMWEFAQSFWVEE